MVRGMKGVGGVCEICMCLARLLLFLSIFALCIVFDFRFSDMCMA